MLPRKSLPGPHIIFSFSSPFQRHSIGPYKNPLPQFEDSYAYSYLLKSHNDSGTSITGTVCTCILKYPNKDSDLDDVLKVTVGEEDGF